MSSERVPDTVSPIEPLASLRAHPNWYFQSGVFERETVISLLIREALLSAYVTRAWVLEDGPWTSVSADGDWLAGDLRSFSMPTPFPEGGVNAIRAEVLLSAFCDAVATVANGRRDDIELTRRQELPGSMTAALGDAGEGRVIVFRSGRDERTDATLVSTASDIFSQGKIDESLQRLEQYARA